MSEGESFSQKYFRYRGWIPLPLYLAILAPLPGRDPRWVLWWGIGLGVVAIGSAFRLWAIRHIGRSAQPYLRTLLVQAAWRIWRSTRADLAPLRDWARQVAVRRGQRMAVVALARRVLRILFAMWRDGAPYRVPVRRETVAA